MLPKAKAVKIKQHRSIPSGYQLKSVTINQLLSGKYYASILFEYAEEIKPVEPKRIIGLDFSMKELYVSSDHEFGNYPRFYRKSLTKLTKEQRVVGVCH